MSTVLEAPPFDPDDVRLDGMTDEELAALPDARVEDAFSRTHAAIERLEVRRLRLLGEVDRRRSYEKDGYLSVPHGSPAPSGSRIRPRTS